MELKAPEYENIIHCGDARFIAFSTRATDAEDAQPILPGANVPIDKAVRITPVDLVAVVDLVSLGYESPPRWMGIRVFEKTSFRIIKLLKGHAKGIIRKRLTFSLFSPLEKPESVREGSRYVTVFATTPNFSVVVKMLPDNKTTERDVAAAITRLSHAPLVFFKENEDYINREEELEEALIHKEVGMIALVRIVKLDYFPEEIVGTFSGNFNILKVFKPMDEKSDQKNIHLIGPLSDFPKYPGIEGQYIIVCDPTNGRILRMFPDTKETDRNIAAAIAAVKRYPPSPN